MRRVPNELTTFFQETPRLLYLLHYFWFLPFQIELLPCLNKSPQYPSRDNNFPSYQTSLLKRSHLSHFNFIPKPCKLLSTFLSFLRYRSKPLLFTRTSSKNEIHRSFWTPPNTCPSNVGKQIEHLSTQRECNSPLIFSVVIQMQLLMSIFTQTPSDKLYLEEVQ